MLSIFYQFYLILKSCVCADPGFALTETNPYVRAATYTACVSNNAFGGDDGGYRGILRKLRLRTSEVDGI